ncbi:MAG: hypothetical protein HY843_05965 [Bdellovibrio sp.]|nr:hypothetical protein [Bdellovibrio sp.]
MARSKVISNYPRTIAIQILSLVLNDKIFLDEAINKIILQKNLKDGDFNRAWLNEICSGTLRWWGRLEFILNSVAMKKKPTGWLKKILLIAVYQLIAQEKTNPKSVIFETVEEIKKEEGLAPSKFANAVLRKILNHAKQWKDLEFKNKFFYELASLPQWLCHRLVSQYGNECIWKFAIASLERPSLWLRSLDTIEEAKIGSISGSYMLKTIPIKKLKAFQEGRCYVQDISNQILVQEISDFVKTQEDQQRVLDLCASPGGKTVGLAWNGFQVIATDKDNTRLELLKDTLHRMKLTQVQVINKSQINIMPDFDLVWVDPPCMSTGILRRHPEIRWIKKEEDVKVMTKLQQELILEGWRKVKPGGFLAYTVCSILKEEGSELIEKANLKNHVIKQWLLMPHEFPYGDAFFGALLKK